MTGYTLAFQMGVEFERILDPLDGPFEKIEGFASVPAGDVTGTGGAGFLLSHQVNDSFVAINRLLASGEDVCWLKPAGAIFIVARPGTAAKIDQLAREKGLHFERVAARPSGDALRLKPVRVGVVDVYGGSMPSGWVQWILTQYGFPFEVIYPPALDAGDLAKRFDVLVLENGIVPDLRRAETGGGGARQSGPDPASIPEEYRGRLGRITAEKTLPQLRQFLDEGGSIVAIGSSTGLARVLSVPVADALSDEKGVPLPAEKFYIPGSILRARADTTHRLAYGLPEQLDVFYDNTPVFRLAPVDGVRPVVWFDSDQPVRSGWAFGQQYLKGGVAVAETTVGKGKLVLLGPLVAFRAHPHGTFKLLFNGIYFGSAVPVRF